MKKRYLTTIRARFLVLACLFTLSVLGASWYAHNSVSDTTHSAFDNTQSRIKLRDNLNSIVSHVVSFERQLLNYLIDPRDKDRDRIISKIDAAIYELPHLQNETIFAKQPDIGQLTEELKGQLLDIRSVAANITLIRIDTEEMYPGSRTLTEEMLPHNEQFSNQASLALHEAEENLSPEGRKVYTIFSEARHAWLNMSGAFRIYIANRTGIFGSPEKGMAAQRQNIRVYAEQVDKYLQQLEILKNQGALGLYQGVALEEMSKANTHWQNAYQKARTIYESDDWRMDVPYYRKQISPLMKRINENLESLSANLEQFANEDISELGAIARTLRSSVWGIGLFALMITTFTYLLFVYSVERPLASIVRALKAEAEGEQEIELPETDLQETRDLVDSFVYLRKQVHQRQKRLEAILENAGEAIVTIDENGLIETFNDAAEELFEYRADEVIGKNVSLLMPIPERHAHDGYMKKYHDTGKATIIGNKREEQAMRKDGSLFPISLKVSEMELEGRRYYTGIIEDISEQKAILDHLKHMAQHDGLTGLYNRDYFQESLARAVEQVSRSPDAHYAMLYIDLDNFKFINDTMGHDAGDQLLVEVSSLLRKRTRRSDILARFGGDEFTVLLADVDIDKAEHIAESFRQQMAEYNFIHSGHNVDVACSIGVSAITQYSATPENVLSEADFACNLAKRNGRNQIHVFREHDRENVTSMSLDMSWSRRIKDALEQDRFVLALQPIVDLNTSQAVYSEVLLRMLDENGDIIMPGGFLPSAERFGLAKELDKWVISQSIRTLAGIQQDNPGARFAINLSAQTLADLTVCDLIHKCLMDFDVDAAALTFEITETSAIADMNEAVSFISRLNMLGCRTALDDFGTGMSSFGYLRDLPVNMVKIDGRFIRQIAHNKVDQAMVSAMNEIAKALGLSTVAEFIEDQDCVDVLKRIGVDYGQGYYLGKPALVTQQAAAGARPLPNNVIPLG